MIRTHRLLPLLIGAVAVQLVISGCSSSEDPAHNQFADTGDPDTPDVGSVEDVAEIPDVGEEPDVSTEPDVGEELDVSTEPDISTGPDVGEEPDVSTEPDVGEEPEVPGSPQNFSASDGEFAEWVQLSWDAVDGAVGYRILRDEASLATVDQGTLEYRDEDALPSGVGAPEDVVASTDRAMEVRVSWSDAPVIAAPVHEYRVIALFEDDESPASARRLGRRGAGPVSHEVQIGDAEDWVDAGDEMYFDDDQAEGPELLYGPLNVGKGSSTEGISLGFSETRFDPGDEREYRVRAVGDDGAGAPSEVVTGYRNFTEDNLTVQWERATDESFGDGVTPEELQGFSAFDDEAPTDGSTVYYRAIITNDEIPDHLTPHEPGFVAHDCVDDLDFKGRPGELTSALPIQAGSGIETLEIETNGMSIPNGSSEDIVPAVSIQNATVTEIRRFPESDFVLEDNISAVRVRFNEDLPEPVEVGQRVSMDVLEVRAFSNFIHISEVQGFTVESSDNPVHVREASMYSQAQLRELPDRIVRIFGRLTEEEGSCGNATCYTMEIGPSDALQEITYRSTSGEIAEGQCITFVGPLSLHPGPHPTDPSIQRAVELDSFDWNWTNILDD